MRFELQNVSRSWGRRVALQQVSLTIEPGERVALIGPSGGGKTTLLRLLGGALSPNEGAVFADGQALDGLTPRAIREHRSAMGLIAQGGGLVPQLTVHRNVTAGRLAHWPWTKTLASMVWSMDKAATRDLLASVGLADRQWDRTSTLSGGQQQRVAIARALAGRPQVILADEPTAGLDRSTADEIVDLLLARTGDDRLTFLVSTHWVSMARARFDRLLGIREGRVVFDRPATDVDDALLDALYEGSRERR